MNICKNEMLAKVENIRVAKTINEFEVLAKQYLGSASLTYKLLLMQELKPSYDYLFEEMPLSQREYLFVLMHMYYDDSRTQGTCVNKKLKFSAGEIADKKRVYDHNLSGHLVRLSKKGLINITKNNLNNNLYSLNFDSLFLQLIYINMDANIVSTERIDSIASILEIEHL